MTCRDIPPHVWAQAEEAVINYLALRLGVHNATDVAQDTMLTVLRRSDFEFEKEEDFLRVCLGFAKRVGPESRRSAERRATDVLTSEPPDQASGIAGLDGPEVAIYLKEMLALGKQHLSERDYRLLERATVCDGKELMAEFDFPNVQTMRVHLYRIRKELAKLGGWTKPSRKAKI